MRSRTPTLKSQLTEKGMKQATRLSSPSLPMVERANYNNVPESIPLDTQASPIVLERRYHDCPHGFE